MPTLRQSDTRLGQWLRGLLARAHANTARRLGGEDGSYRLGAAAPRAGLRGDRSRSLNWGRPARLSSAHRCLRVMRGDGLTVNRRPGSLWRKMALDAAPFMRTETSGSPSWPTGKGRPDTFTHCSD